jgi:hypothetical protein
MEEARRERRRRRRLHRSARSFAAAATVALCVRDVRVAAAGGPHRRARPHREAEHEIARAKPKSRMTACWMLVTLLRTAKKALFARA